METLTWILLATLAAGLAMIAAGLCRDIDRYRQWRRIREEHDGEIVLGDRAMTIGQEAIVTAGSSVTCAAFEGALLGYVTQIDSRQIRVEVANVPDGATAPGGGAWPPDEATVRCTFPGTDAIYRCSLLVSGVEDRPSEDEETTIRTITLSRPAWLARIQRRKHFRSPVSLGGTMEIPDGTVPRDRMAPFDPNVVLPCTVINLSESGLSALVACGDDDIKHARASHGFVPGMITSVHLALPALSETPILARVLTARKTDTLAGLGLHVSCEFLPMAPWEHDLLVQYLFAEQRSQLRERFRNPDERIEINA